jgi:hypothetical protein
VIDEFNEVNRLLRVSVIEVPEVPDVVLRAPLFGVARASEPFRTQFSTWVLKPLCDSQLYCGEWIIYRSGADVTR